MTATPHRLLILGTGPAGYSAALYASRANLRPVIISGNQEGGQLTTTTDVDNWPGDEQGVQGPELMRRMREHAQRFGAQLVTDHIHRAQLEEHPFRLSGAREYCCEALIIATGASAKYLGLASEQAFLGKGVSACATCDGFFYKDQQVAVVGGGNTAVEEALYLSNIARQVTLIHRRDQLRAEKLLAERLLARSQTGNIELLWHHVLDEVLGDARGVNGIRVRDVRDQSTRQLSVHGVFIAIGHEPNTSLFSGQLAMDNGYIRVRGGVQGGATETSIPGVFAAGDVSDPVYRQAVTSAGSGCMAALDAESWLDSRH